MNTNTLFSLQSKKTINKNAPLAEKLRPKRLEEFIGQDHLVGKDKPLKIMIENDEPFSIILWGPPGTGKTTLAKIIANTTKSHFEFFSATSEGVKRLKEIVNIAEEKRIFTKQRTILFVDEIHRLNKGQQDAFLPYTENGELILIGATTENPSFEVNSALLSRMRVFILNSLEKEHLEIILKKGLKLLKRKLDNEAKAFLLEFSQGDARVLLNNLEFACSIIRKDLLSVKDLEYGLQKKALRYDKSGEEHYNIISALHKSMRDSDPDGTLYWFTRMIEAGEDPLYIARRMIRFASEDIGNADPQALQMAIAAKDAYHFLGSPEGELSLAHCAVYLANAKKSNTIYSAFKSAFQIIKKTGTLPVPLHLRNAPTKLMKDIGYGKGYKYAHNFKEAKVEQEHMPDRLKGVKLFKE